MRSRVLVQNQKKKKGVYGTLWHHMLMFAWKNCRSWFSHFFQNQLKKKKNVSKECLWSCWIRISRVGSLSYLIFTMRLPFRKWSYFHNNPFLFLTWIIVLKCYALILQKCHQKWQLMHSLLTLSNSFQEASMVMTLANFPWPAHSFLMQCSIMQFAHKMFAIFL